MQKKLEFCVCNLIGGYFKSKGSAFIPGNAFILIVDKCENKIFFQSKKKELQKKHHLPKWKAFLLPGFRGIYLPLAPDKTLAVAGGMETEGWAGSQRSFQEVVAVQPHGEIDQRQFLTN
jgi:hypothetical protein